MSVIRRAARDRLMEEDRRLGMGIERGKMTRTSVRVKLWISCTLLVKRDRTEGERMDQRLG
jgi:hypothetical protein